MPGDESPAHAPSPGKQGAFVSYWDMEAEMNREEMFHATRPTLGVANVVELWSTETTGTPLHRPVSMSVRQEAPFPISQMRQLGFVEVTEC